MKERKQTYFSIIILLLSLASCSLYDDEEEVCFIGDSITYLWDLDYYFPSYKTKKYAVSGAIVQDIDKWGVENCSGLPIVFLMGTNNIGYISVDDEKAAMHRSNLRKTLMKRVVKLNAKPLLFISILPRDYLGRQSPLINVNIELQNNENKNGLDSIMNEHIYIDAFKYFLDEDYKIKEFLFNDGLHPSPEGYEILSALVQKWL